MLITRCSIGSKASSGIDFRVILVADYPPAERNFAICIGAPLSTDAS